MGIKALSACTAQFFVIEQRSTLTLSSTFTVVTLLPHVGLNPTVPLIIGKGKVKLSL
jgi:hypothetical protein